MTSVSRRNLRSEGTPKPVPGFDGETRGARVHGSEEEMLGWIRADPLAVRWKPRRNESLQHQGVEGDPGDHGAQPHPVLPKRDLPLRIPRPDVRGNLSRRGRPPTPDPTPRCSRQSLQEPPGQHPDRTLGSDGHPGDPWTCSATGSPRRGPRRRRIRSVSHHRPDHRTTKPHTRSR